MNNYLDKCAQKLTKIHYSIVPNTADDFLRSHSRLKLAKKFLHRYVSLAVSGQLRREIRRIEAGMRVLWIYAGKSNFGDAIMDLSGRALLRNANIALELLTLSKLQPLFSEDDVFARVYSSVEQIEDRGYDAIVLNEFNYQSIDLKVRYFAKLPFACLFQYFYGPDRNQTLFSFAAVNAVFQRGLGDSELLEVAKPYLSVHETTRRAVDQLFSEAAPDLALAVGGIDVRRTYDAWLAVLQWLDRTGVGDAPLRVALLGSDNGLAIARDIANHAFHRLEVNSFVADLSLLEAREVVARCRLFVGCDGGLMHVAHTTDTPSLSLFAHLEPPHLRLTKRCQSLAIHSKGGVNEVAPETVARAIIGRLAPVERERNAGVPLL